MTRFVGLLAALAVVACSNATGPQHLSFEGRSTISQTDPIGVAAVVTVTNIGVTTTQIDVGECSLTLEAFANPGRTGTPAWHQDFRLCDAMGRPLMLYPGDYHDYHVSGTIPSTLPAGTYYLAVEMGYAPVPAGEFTKP
jgi:hypothetical protein